MITTPLGVTHCDGIDEEVDVVSLAAAPPGVEMPLLFVLSEVPSPKPLPMGREALSAAFWAEAIAGISSVASSALVAIA